MTRAALGVAMSVGSMLVGPVAVADLAASRVLVTKGDYAAAEQGLRAIRGAERAVALIALARVEIETGRYGQAERSAAEAARTAGVRVEAVTVEGEALAATGRYDEAERAWRSVADRPRGARARSLLARLLAERGRTAEAEPIFESFADDYNNDRVAEQDAEGLTYVAVAVQALGSFREANETFQLASRADPARVETQLLWAEMFLQKYDTGHAEESVREALRANPNSAPAHVRMARIKMEQSFDFLHADRELDAALRVNPNSVEAHAFRAALRLRDLDFAGAEPELRAALAVNPNDLYALSLVAAARFLADDRAGFDTAQRDVLRRNPKYAAMYGIVAEFADWEHRYEEIVALMAEAQRVDPQWWPALAHIGMNRLRMGDEERGIEALRQAWDHDRFNVRVANLLNLYDETIRRDYVVEQTKNLRVRMARAERDVLRHYAPGLLERAWAAFVQKYGFTPQGPVQIEMYATEEAFSVRTAGLPNVGVQGVCFGKVVTALSPGGGPFNWGQILWHELAHVFSIQLSRSRVPRWFTEGLAEYEATLPRPEWQRENDDDLYRVLAAGRLAGVEQLHTAFTHAHSGEEVLVAYYASYLLVRHIVEQFGFPRVVEMLRQYGQGRRTGDVIRRVLGIEPAALDAQFRAATERRLARYAQSFRVYYPLYADLQSARDRVRQNPADAGAHAALAAALVFDSKREDAAREASEALRLEPANRVALFVRMDVAQARGDAPGAQAAAQALIAAGADGYRIRMVLASVARRARDAAAEKAALEAAHGLDPQQTDPLDRLAEMAVAEHREDDAIRLLAALADLDQHDRNAHRRLIELLVARSRWAEVREYATRALYADPMSALTHSALGRALAVDTSGPSGPSRRREAIAEYEVALVCRPAQPAPVHAALARLYLDLGDRGRARTAANAAVGADAQNAEAREVLRRLGLGR